MTGAKVVLDTGERITVTGVHPVADLFPMLDKEGLADLAASIGERGQEHPIVLDNEDRVLDGRNRLASCQIAGVEPKAVRYDGTDPAGYALAVNIARRHLSTGARAIVAAQAARLNGTTGKDAAANTKIGINRIAEAAVILDWAPDLTDAILTGAQPLSVALKTARERKVDAEQLAAKITRLKADAPDLTTLVEEERMGVDDAIAALDGRVSAEERERAEAEKYRAEALAKRVDALDRAVDFLTEFAQWPERATDLRGAYVPLYPSNGITVDKLRLAVDGLNAVRKAWA